MCCQSRSKRGARKREALIVPEANAREAAMVKGIDIYGVQNLRDDVSISYADKQRSPPCAAI